MITVATVYYENGNVPSFSRCYTPEWVDKLYRGIQRWYDEPFRFICLTDKTYKFEENIEQEQLLTTQWDTACKQLYGVAGDRLCLLGLDTIITGDLHDLFNYRGDLCVPTDPYDDLSPCNGVVLCPSRPDIAARPGNDMRVLDQFQRDWLDELYPGQVKSFKCQVAPKGLGDARIVYFHGVPKPDTLEYDWILENWK
jgi:hypothetical protein